MTYAEQQVNNDLDQGIQRIIRLKEKAKAISEDIKEVKSELKSQGYDIKVVNAVIKLMEMEDSDRQEYDFTLDAYREKAGISSK